MGKIRCPDCGKPMDFQVAGGWGNYITFETCYPCKTVWRCYPWGQRDKENLDWHRGVPGARKKK